MSGMSKANARQNTRYKARYQTYKLNDTREKNKAYRIIKHLERYPDDLTAQKALDKLQSFCVKSARKLLSTRRGQLC